MNFKRARSRRQIRCSMCTPNRWRGNSESRFKIKDIARMREPVYPDEVGPHEEYEDVEEYFHIPSSDW